MPTIPAVDRPDGVYFEACDYAGFVRRGICDVIDVVVLFFTLFVMGVASVLLRPGLATPMPMLVGPWVILCFLYLAPL